MKILLNFVLTSILAITLVVMASGVTFHHCSCSGKTTILLGHLSDTKPEKAPDAPQGCMTLTSVSLSPTTPMHPVAFDFHVFQPLVAIVNDWHLFSLTPQQVESTRSFLPTDYFSPPPRQYLHLLRILTI